MKGSRFLMIGCLCICLANTVAFANEREISQSADSKANFALPLMVKPAVETTKVPQSKKVEKVNIITTIPKADKPQAAAPSSDSSMGSIILAENRDFAVVDGSKVTMPRIIIESGRTLVPLHFFRLMKDDSKVFYNPAEKSVTIAANGKVVRIVADEMEIRINGQPKLIDVPMKIYGDRAYVPVRYIAEMFKYDVSFIKNLGSPTMIGISKKGDILNYNKALEIFG